MAKSKPKQEQTKSKGRPAGAKNHPVLHAEGELTRCPSCSSTNRAPYINRHEQEFAGTDGDGHPYTHIVRRRTQCLDCGQHRIDRHVENRGAKK